MNTEEKRNAPAVPDDTMIWKRDGEAAADDDRANDFFDRTPEPPPEDDAPEETPRSVRVLVYLAVVLTAAFVLAYFTWICAGDVFALSKPDRSVSVVISEDDTVADVTDKLAESGLIRYKWLFRLYCGVTHADRKISAGTYTLNNVYDYHALVNGMRETAETRKTVKVLIPEGYNCSQIFAALEEKGVCSRADLEAAAASYRFDYDFLSKLPYGEKNRLEGYLFPDTYEFYVGDDPVRVIEKFLKNFKTKMNAELTGDIAKLNDTLRQKMQANGFSEAEIAENQMDLSKVIIVASLIEKETGGVSESSSISSVIYNRLSSKVYPLLEIDASVRYGLDKWDDDLTAADLASDTPYNTRKYPGLPVGAISNPGIDSIRAAIYPRETKYYFYVLTPTGFHHFSETYYEHQAFIEEMKKRGN